MPVRSSNSPVLKWPERRQVHVALTDWARAAALRDPSIRRVGYFGSYARDTWGVGSDLDVVIIVATATAPFTARAAGWNLTSLPVPVQVLAYTEAEWASMSLRDERFDRTIAHETVWVYP